jgi:hypothetical protein
MDPKEERTSGVVRVSAVARARLGVALRWGEPAVALAEGDPVRGSALL